GMHQVEARARDHSGNLAATAPLSFTVDSTAPEIVIEGVADDGLYGEPVRPVVSMVDAHPGELELSLDGQPFVSGSLLERSGRYRLSVRATDQLGHSAQVQIEFGLDLEPVTIELFSPAEG